MCECCDRRERQDRAMWLAMARALGTVANGITGVVRAIERRYGEQAHRKAA